MKLLSNAVSNPWMCVKGDNPSPKYFKGDNCSAGRLNLFVILLTVLVFGKGIKITHNLEHN